MGLHPSLIPAIQLGINMVSRVYRRTIVVLSVKSTVKCRKTFPLPKVKHEQLRVDTLDFSQRVRGSDSRSDTPVEARHDPAVVKSLIRRVFLAVGPSSLGHLIGNARTLRTIFIMLVQCCDP